jgi:ketosteroid isomerase-like protein
MNDKETADELAALMKDWAAAIVSNDATAIGHFMADEWVIVSQTGISTKIQFLSFVESGDLTHSAMEMIDDNPRIKIYYDMAVVTARVTNTAHYKGDEFLADEWTTDVFRKIDGEWKCVLTHITEAEDK